MIVGCSNIDSKELKQLVVDGSDCVRYAEELVPIWARHISGIVANQRYYMALLIRNMTSIPYKKRKLQIDSLLDGIALTGIANNICTIDDIISICDKDKLVEALRIGENYEQET